MKNHGVQLDVILNGVTLLSVTMDYKIFNEYYDSYQSILACGRHNAMLCFVMDLDDFTNATKLMQLDL